MRYVYGTVISGIPTLSNPAQIAYDLGVQFGTSFSNLEFDTSHSGFDVGGSWTTGDYFLKSDYGADGTALLLQMFYDPSNGEIYRDLLGSSSNLGRGGYGTCKGCSRCYAQYDENLKIVKCGCASGGTSCSLSSDILT